MFKQLKTITCGLAILASTTLASTSLAQTGNFYARQVYNRMQGISKEMTEKGYTKLAATPINSIPEEATAPLSVLLTLEGREYAFFGVCDANCEGLKLVLSTPDGQEIGRSVLENERYELLVSEIPQQGVYELSVEMEDCNTQECYFGMEMWAAGDIPGRELE